MRRFGWVAIGALVGMWVSPLGARSSSVVVETQVAPLTAMFRLDDNVFRRVSLRDRKTDTIYSLNAGGTVSSQMGSIWRGTFDYRIGMDVYQHFTDQDNVKNDIGLSIAASPDRFQFSFQKNYFVRKSDYFNFDYWDDNNLVTAHWAPGSSWTSTLQYKNFSRRYFDTSPTVRSRNYLDEGLSLEVQRQAGERLQIRAQGAYGSREFNRYAIALNGGTLQVLPDTQLDKTWNWLVGVRWYLASILQNVTVQDQDTASNSYGFSNRARSVSWAAVVNPTHSLYLQLFFRLYHKRYDVNPLTIPEFQTGFNDEDGQDLLSAKASWDWESQWTSSVTFSRLRNESTMPSFYYIKHLVVFQVQHRF